MHEYILIELESHRVRVKALIFYTFCIHTQKILLCHKKRRILSIFKSSILFNTKVFILLLYVLIMFA